MFGFFKKKDDNSGFSLKSVLAKTSEGLLKDIKEFESKSELDDFLLDDLEEHLIKADVGVGVAGELADEIRANKSIKPAQMREYLKSRFLDILSVAGGNELSYVEGELNIYFITGVNGAGKTTLIGKLAKKFVELGKKVLVVAADTFRAAAEEQLDIWSKRAGAEILRKDGADPAAVVYDGIQMAKNDDFDVILIDTAGRLQNKFNLMQELSKIKSVIDKNAADTLRESILVLDANTGQNGLQQAKVFHEATKLTCVGLTKLDGSARGGVVVAVAKELKLPVKLIGVGEKIDDLREFHKEEFVDALFA